MSAELRRAVPLLLLFTIGLAAGVWVFVSPWALGYPTAGGWSGAVWSGVWAGGIVAAVSAVCLVALVAGTLHLAERARPRGD